MSNKKKQNEEKFKNKLHLKNVTETATYAMCNGQSVVIIPQHFVRPSPKIVCMRKPRGRMRLSSSPPYGNRKMPSIFASRQVTVFATPDEGVDDYTADAGDEPAALGTGRNRKGRPKGSKNKSLYHSFNRRCEKRSFTYAMRSGPSVKCVQCGRLYDGDALAHSLEHHKTICPVCGRFYSSSLAKHIRSHGMRHQGQIFTVTCYECYDCREKFGNAQTMAEHLLDEHVGDGGHVNGDVSGGEGDVRWCALCDSTDFVDTEDGLRDHVAAVHAADATGFPHMCAHCGESQRDRAGLVTHLVEKHSRKTAAVVVDDLGCVSCGVRFADRAAVADHLVDVHCPRKTFSHPVVYRCRVCKAGFKTQINVLRHACNGIKSPHCDRCDKTFPSKMRYAFHLQFHEHPKYARMHLHCDLCLAEFADENHLYDHIRFRHELHDKAVCEVCGRTFKSSMGLNIHRRYHNGLRNFACKLCDKSFLNKSTLKEHEISHMDVKPFQCHICGQYLSRASRLRSHVKTHRAAESTEQTCYCCGTCGFVAPGPGLLTEHVNKEHGAGGEDRTGDTVVQLTSVVKCEFCDSTYADAARLDEHRDTVHTNTADDTEAFVCVVCSSAFSTYSRLTTHKLTHGINVESVMADIGHESEHCNVDGRDRFHIPQYFSCQHCAKMCLHYTYFCLHRRLKHAPGVQAHTCDQCCMNFKTSWKLAYHKKTVHEQRATVKLENKYQCTVCQRKFVKLGALNLHKTRTHIDMIGDVCKYLCHRCGKFFSSEESLRSHDRDNASGENGYPDPVSGQWRHRRKTYKRPLMVATRVYHPPTPSPLPSTPSPPSRPLSPPHQLQSAAPEDTHPCDTRTGNDVVDSAACTPGVHRTPLLPPSADDTVCVLCHSRFCDPVVFRQHLRDHVSQNGVFLCESCFMPFLSYVAFEVHAATWCPTARVPPVARPEVRFLCAPKDEPADEPKPLVVDCSDMFKATTPPKPSTEELRAALNVSTHGNASHKAPGRSLVNELFSIISTPRTSAVLDQMDSVPPDDIDEIFDQIADPLG